MQIETKGIVLKEYPIKERDKVLTVLTPDLGKITVWANNARTVKSPIMGASQLLAYSELTLNEKGGNYYLSRGAVLNVFFELRQSIEKLTLAQYFCEFCNTVTVDGYYAEQVLRLLLNSVYLLCKQDTDIFLIKTVFELRMMFYLGFMPDIQSCHCCNTMKDNMLFDVKGGCMKCQDCAKGQEEGLFWMNKAVYLAMRHILTAPAAKVFSFKLEQESKKQLERIVESFCLMQLDCKFQTLEFFKNLM